MEEKYNNILIAGGSGMIGSAMVEYFRKQGHRLAILSRSAKDNGGKVFLWDTVESQIDDEAMEWADVVINLAGQGIADKLWTEKRKKALIDSRIDSTRLLIDAIAKAKNPPRQLINASAIGYYGDGGEQWLDEDSPQGNDFMADLCARWEEEAKRVISLDSGVHLGIVRIGIVLSSKGGFLDPLRQISKFRVGGYFGSGKQYISWIAIEDLIRIFEWVMLENQPNITVDGVGSEPAYFMDIFRSIAKAQGHGILLIPTPEFIAKLILGDMSAVFLNSVRVRSNILEKEGVLPFDKELDDILKKIYQ